MRKRREPLIFTREEDEKLVKILDMIWLLIIIIACTCNFFLQKENNENQEDSAQVSVTEMSI